MRRMPEKSPWLVLYGVRPAVAFAELCALQDAGEQRSPIVNGLFVCCPEAGLQASTKRVIHPEFPPFAPGL